MKSRFLKSALALAVGLLAVTSAGCGEPASAYPREVEITYRVTSTDPALVADVRFTNASSGITEVEDAALPYAETVTTTVLRQHALAELSVHAETGGELTLEIAVDGEVVASEAFSGEDSIGGVLLYSFE